VIAYGLSATYSIFVLRKGFREDNRINYLLLFAGFVFHTTAMFKRGFSLERCPINNLYEATIFIVWTIVASYLLTGAWARLRFLGAFASPLIFAIGVFALMPSLDVHAARPTFTGGWSSLHKALILLAYGAFGLSSVAGLMYLTQEHDLKFHKLRAVLSRLPPIQRLELVTGRLLEHHQVKPVALLLLDHAGCLDHALPPGPFPTSPSTLGGAIAAKGGETHPRGSLLAPRVTPQSPLPARP